MKVMEGCWNDGMLACVGKMLKSREYSNCHAPLSQQWINGRYQTSNNMFT